MSSGRRETCSALIYQRLCILGWITRSKYAQKTQPTQSAMPVHFQALRDFRSEIIPVTPITHAQPYLSIPGACCGNSGYCGYGGTHCGDGSIPNDICWSNCNAKAECGRDASSFNATCPLNVCCSEFGFCGTTSDFCGAGCQSNCKMPDGSGAGRAAASNVQSRIVGYYEAWKAKDTCASLNLGLKEIPLGSLTHLIVSFGSITPNTYEIQPMAGVTDDTLMGFTALKASNPSTKIMISLGGWAFTDDGADTQAVFTTMVNNDANIDTFVKNLLAFLSHYGFDGVDFDWEYPGAPDRGGNSGDAAGYLKLLQKFRVAQFYAKTDYVTSFTVPTSFYYLQNYATPDDTSNNPNLFVMASLVDFINVMSYDLHGTWDGPKDQIGNVVLAHTNLTEIEQAFALFWRIGIKPDVFNLGVGFYGRSYQLTDPSCYQPGCLFSGGAKAGPCTKTSGILSYKEIMDIMTQNDITPVWDRVDAVKYLTWNDKYWVSFDDEDTFQQKIEWANSQGIGGLSVWAIDLDTNDLQALQGLLYPGGLNSFYDNVTTSADWRDVQGGQCHLSDCDGACNIGEVVITTQKCNDKYGQQGTSKLCCPADSAPDPSTCTWRGNPTLCNGRCHENEVALQQNPWGGGGAKCTDGNKVYCCPLPSSLQSHCRTTECGGSCNDDENSIAGDFFDNCALKPKKLCCPKNSPYQANVCHWKGKDGSCYDNVCAFDTEVQLTQSWDGGGGSCGSQSSRDRVFCCTAPGGVQPFLPVPLEYLFPNPPTGDDVNAKYKLSVDDTWGRGGDNIPGSDSSPDSATFGFFVMVSPEALQVSLRKRDGTHWEMFDCENTQSDEIQTVRIFCNDDSLNSNCHKIYLGHGVPGKILDMPSGCGLGPYAVAVEMVPSKNQSVPGHITKRTTKPNPVVYDLTFDYDFRRVPRDLGDTQWRLDYSNEEGYWDTVVDSPGMRRRKRSFEEHGGNHREFLEDSWHTDLTSHLSGLLTRDELHARWFGSDAIAWLKQLFTVEVSTPPITHSVSETLNVILLDETYQCTIKGVDISANLLVEAQTSVSIDTSFGLTMIGTLGTPVDLSGSYLWFKNSGNIQALFMIDALVSAHYDTKDVELFGLENFGATFSIPGIVTVGPNFKLYGSVNFDLSLSGKFEAHVTLADWDTQLVLPDRGSDADPKSTDTPGTDGTQAIGKPTIDWSINANGQITAHIKPVASFGIDFNPKFISVPSTTINLVADGWVTAYASAVYSSTDADFCYGVNAGASLYVSLDVPPSLQWVLPGGASQYPLWSSPPYAIIEQTCSATEPDTNGSTKRGLSDKETRRFTADFPYKEESEFNKRSLTLGPLLRIPTLSCPFTADDVGAKPNVSTCPLCGEDYNQTNSDPTLVSKRWQYAALGIRQNDEDDTAPSCEIVYPSTDGDGQVECNYASFSAKRDLEESDDGWSWPMSDWLQGTSSEVGNTPAKSKSILGRRLKTKEVMVKINGVGYWISVGGYKECGAAQADSTIDKNFLFDNSAAACTPNMVKLTNSEAKKYAGGMGFQRDFMIWLCSGVVLPGGWVMPSTNWGKLNALNTLMFSLPSPGSQISDPTPYHRYRCYSSFFRMFS
ncbi:glycosyl hydrolase family 18 protein [Rutstroemia sp. NJR-2017a BBW]|nr:glycosyl hydrolase family 18 protein [Rutstroemia sp. NJR-2017a BBW]